MGVGSVVGGLVRRVIVVSGIRVGRGRDFVGVLVDVASFWLW